MQGQPGAAPVQVQPHCGAAAAMFQGVGQAFLDDPENRELLPGGEPCGRTGLALFDGEAVLHACDQRPDVAELGLGRDYAVVVYALDDALRVHQGTPGRRRDVFQGVQHGPRLVLAQVAGAVRLRRDHREGMGQDIVQVPADPRPFLLHDQLHLGFPEAGLGYGPGLEKAAALLVEGQCQPDGGARAGDDRQKGEELPAVLHERGPVTAERGTVPAESAAVTPGEHEHRHDSREGQVGPGRDQPGARGCRPLNDPQRNERANVDGPVVVVHRGNGVPELAREQSRRESERHIGLPGGEGDGRRHEDQRPRPRPGVEPWPHPAGFGHAPQREKENGRRGGAPTPQNFQ